MLFLAGTFSRFAIAQSVSADAGCFASIIARE